MAYEQIPLFQRKTFAAVLREGIAITSPSAESTVLSTLSAYFAYLQSLGDSQYTPGDFCGDVKKFGLFLPHDKALKDITTHDIRSFLSQMRTKEHMTEK